MQISNTLFLNFWAIDINIDFDIELGDAMLQKAFHYCPECDYIIWLAHKTVRLTDYMKERFIEVDLGTRPVSMTVDPLKNFRIFAMPRSKFLPKLQVREARVEDNDDLLPILKQSNPHILETQDRFFLADLIESQDKRNRFYVGVDNNVPIGMLATSLDVNVNMVSKIFNVDGYDDLLKTEAPRMEVSQLLMLALVNSQETHDMAVMHSVEEGCTVMDASKCDLLKQYDDQPDDDDTISLEQVIRALMERITVALAEPVPSGKRKGQTPHACLVVNFPRNHTEGRAFLALLAQEGRKVDTVIDMNPSKELDEYADESELSVFDAMVRALRRTLVRDGTIEDETIADVNDTVVVEGRLHTTEWIKLAAHEENLLDQFLAVLRCSVDSHKENALLEFQANEKRLSSTQYGQVANGFALTVFCMKKEYESRAEDLLKVAFEEHPKLDYCLLMLPNNGPPTALTRLLTQIKVRPGISFDQSLHIMHRQTLLGHEHLFVSRMIVSLESKLYEYLSPLGKDAESVMDMVINSLRENDVDLKDNPSEATFVAMVSGEIVGVMCLSRKVTSTEDVNWMRANYQIDDHVNFDRHRGRAQAAITEWVMAPTFTRWSRFMLREVMRHYGKTLLYYQCPTGKTLPREIISEMIPVLPRQRSQPAVLSLLRSKAVRDSFVETIPPLMDRPTAGAPDNTVPLYYITKRNLSEHKHVVSTRIVVVGGSLSTYALLETFIYIPYLLLPHIYLVMESPPHAIKPNNRSTNSSSNEYAGALSISDAGEPLDQMVKALGFGHHVTVITGRLTDIDRANKAIIVSDETVVEYDILVIAGETQDLSYKSFEETRSLHPMKAVARGIFGLGNPTADRAAIDWIVKHQHDNNNAALIVYGSSLEAWNAVGRLISMDIIDTSRINWIIPDIDLPELGDDLIDEVAMMALENSSIKIWRNCKVIHVNMGAEGAGVIQSIEIEKMPEDDEEEDEEKKDDKDKEKGEVVHETVKLLCFGFIGAMPPMCAVDVFAAVNDSGLVFDGGVVVDRNFRTVDPAIYSVGDVSRFSRYFTKILPHHNYNARELGVYCAKRILAAHVDPASDIVQYGFLVDKNVPFVSVPAAASGKLPTINQMKSISMELPGGLFYFRSRLADMPEETVPMITKDHSVGSVFLLRVDSLGIVVEILYIGQEVVETRNLAQLIGWHESYLNGAQFAYNSGIVPDWVTYFRQSWASANYHDKFPELAAGLRKVLESDPFLFNILDVVFDTAENSSDDQLVAGRRRELIGDRCELLTENTKQGIENATLEFLKKHKQILTRFHLPAVKTHDRGDKAVRK